MATDSPESVVNQPLGLLTVVDDIDPVLSHKLRGVAEVALFVVLICAVLAAIGWAFDIAILKHPTDEPALSSAGSINFLFISASILMMAIGIPSMARVIAARTIACLVIMASATTFIEHTCHLQWDDLVLCHFGGGFGLTYPGPLLPHESFFFFVLGFGAALFRIPFKREIWPSQLLSILVFVPSFVVLCCYLLGQSHVCIYFGCVKLSPIAAIVALLSSFGLFFASSDIGLARAFSAKSTTGILARRTSAGMAILVVASLPRQWLIAVGEKAQLVDASTVNIGTAIFAILALCVFGWWCFRKIDSEETAKKSAIAQRAHAIEMMELKSRSRSPSSMKLVCLECLAEYPIGSRTHCEVDQSQLVNVQDNFKPGAVFADRYSIIRELGSGGMSTVYLANHLMMGKKIALKVLQTQLASNPKTIQRFQREARAASGLSHRNLVSIHDFNVTEDGQTYMVMEFLEGKSLADLIDEGKPMEWREAVPLFHEICEGLGHAHDNGVIHRDLKPGNIMLLPATENSNRFTPKIVDFGLAKVYDEAAQQITHTGDVFGSPCYMSPEQCEGNATDLRSDIYAMGCIMYETLTGNPPYSGESVIDTLIMHVSAPLPTIPGFYEVPSWLCSAIYKALAKDPAKRFQTVAELQRALVVPKKTLT